MPRESTIRWRALLIACAVMAVLFWIGQSRLRIDSDITATMPEGDIALVGAKHLLKRHPSIDRLAIDLSYKDGRVNPDGLVDAADQLVTSLTATGLFSSVGTAQAAHGILGLYVSVPENLPVLFSREQLDTLVAPLLAPQAIDDKLKSAASDFTDLSGVGTASRIADDPLGLSDLVLSRLSALIPTKQASIEHGHVMSADKRHVLVSATPKSGMMNTTQAHAVDDAITSIASSWRSNPSRSDIELNAVGGFRAAIDNETMVTSDMNIAITVASIGIALLLLLCFPRPWLGVFALLPAMAGGALALFVYSFLMHDISALALGFGGALLAITVDQGVVYLLFVDRESKTLGRQAAHEVFSIGSLATVINIGSFLALSFSGFRILQQIGVFAALGIAFSYLFVHLIFPHIFPTVPPAKRGPWLPIDRWLKRATVRKGLGGVIAAGVLFAAAACLAKPTFLVDLAAMNTVTGDTARAESKMKTVWGDLFDKVYVLIDAPTVDELQKQSDNWLEFIEAKKSGGEIERAFSTSMLAPGHDVAERNAAAWKAFWTPDRVAALQTNLSEAAEKYGFSPSAFERFIDRVKTPSTHAVAIPGGGLELFGAGPARGGDGVVWLGNVVPGPAYDASRFSRDAYAHGWFVFDGAHFSRTLAGFLQASFLRMLAIVAAFVATCVLLFFLDLSITALALSPLVFAFVCTLGTLRLLGHPIDVPGLMLGILIFGMGVDYSMSLVRVYQRCLSDNHSSHGPVRVSVLLASSATLVGMVTMVTARHAVIRSAGVMASIAVFFCALGAFVILPPVLRRIYAPRPMAPCMPSDPLRWVSRRFRRLSAYPRMFAWFKLRLDPMFPRLQDFVPHQGRVFDIGCGHGVAAAWLLAQFSELQLDGIEPDEDRACTARWVLGDRGSVQQGAAPSIWPPGHADCVMLLDVVHHLDDAALAQTLELASKSLDAGGRLVVRATVPEGRPAPWYRWVETRRLWLGGERPWYRSQAQLRAAIERAGFSVNCVELTGPGREETWFIASRVPGQAG